MIWGNLLIKGGAGVTSGVEGAESRACKDARQKNNQEVLLLEIIGTWFMQCRRVSGGIVLAPEGIKGNQWEHLWDRESVDAVLGFIRADDRLKGLSRMESPVSPEEEALHGHTSNFPLGCILSMGLRASQGEERDSN
ncbi:hypothetical protein MKW98_030890 [Papaver atlanticum]|uniref:Uncharacterized protein n=1 Tax=Papaver atlanticum TaxID=357466 RepID=A0AAD4XTX2_9MAGN|nr:hypothetical protein MKW98_030890 [Papaver atlanticum]